MKISQISRVGITLFLLFCFFQPLKSQNRYAHYLLENLVSNAVDHSFGEYKMESTPDGGFVLANKEWNTPYVFVLKFDSCGYLSWSKRLEKVFAFATCSGMLTDSAGNVAMLFQRYNITQADTAYLIKLDTAGALLWNRKIVIPGDFGKADFAISSNGSYCFGSNYSDPTLNNNRTIVFINASDGSIKSANGWFHPAFGGVDKFANLPDGNLLVKDLNSMFSLNPNTLEIAWSKQYQTLSTGGDTKPLVLSNRIVELSKAAPFTNAIPFFYDLQGNFLYKGATISARQDTYRPFRYGPRKMLKLPGERIAFVSTDSTNGFRPTLVILDSLGQLLSTKHFHPAGDPSKRAAFDLSLLKDGNIAIVGETNDRVEVFKVSAKTTSLDCAFDTIPNLAPPVNFPFVTDPDPVYQVTPFSFFSSSFPLNITDFDPQLQEKCSAIEPIDDKDSLVYLCPKDSAVISLSHLLPITCVWDDGVTGCERVLYPEETRTVSATVRCVTFTQKFTAVEKLDCPCKLEMPNAFTPNGDGANDVFQPVSDCNFLYFDMQVFDRWGQQVFATTDSKSGWDGNKGGAPAASDVYVFQLRYQTSIPGSSPVTDKGGVTLLR